MAIGGYDNEYEIPDEILNLALYIREKFNERETGYLVKCGDKVVKKLQE